MTLYRWFKIKKSVQEITRWSLEGYKNLLVADPTRGDAEIFGALLGLRQRHLPANGRVRTSQETLTSTGQNISDVLHLCLTIIENELRISVANDEKLWKRMCDFVSMELRRLNDNQKK